MIAVHAGPRLTQGSILTCAIAEDYVGCETFGLVITARCDLAHDKVDVYNYLPVVHLNDWLQRDFFRILVDRLLDDAQQQFRSLLANNNVAESVLLAHTEQKIVDTFFPEEATDKQIRKARASGLDLVARLAKLRSAGKHHATQQLLLDLGTTYPKQKDRLLRECVNQQLAGYHFLNRTEPNGQDTGYVVLMREVRHLPQQIGALLSGGLEEGRFRSLCAENPALSSLLAMRPNDFAYCTGKVSSPMLECIMQRFSLLFGRIGVQDPDPAYVSGLWTRQPIVKEAIK